MGTPRALYTLQLLSERHALSFTPLAGCEASPTGRLASVAIGKSFQEAAARTVSRIACVCALILVQVAWAVATAAPDAFTDVLMAGCIVASAHAHSHWLRRDEHSVENSYKCRSG